MQTDNPSQNHKADSWFSIALAIGLLFFSLGIIQNASRPVLPQPSSSLSARFWRADLTGLPVPGNEYSIFKDFLPPNGKISFISDYPFHPYSKTVGQLYAAQNQLAPLILNPNPVEAFSLIYCSSAQIAAERARQTGYRIVRITADGKGIGVKS